MPLSLSDAATTFHTAALKAYVRDEWELEIGDLRASLLLAFVLETVGPSAYNQGVRDAQAHLARQIDDLEVAVHLDEPTG